MYQYQTVVRFSETNEKRVMTLSALLNYLQDVCTFQSEKMNLGFDYLSERGLAWVLGGWEIEIHRMPKMMEEIVIRTWPSSFRNVFGYRCFDMKTVDGEVLAEANSTWLMISLETGKPVKVPSFVGEPYELSPANNVPLPRKHLSLDPMGEINEHKPVTVQKWHLDANHHMNNAQYVRIAQEFNPFHVAGDDKPLKKLRVLYKKAAVLGDVMYPSSFSLEDKVQVMLATEERQPFAIVEFEY